MTRVRRVRKPRAASEDDFFARPTQPVPVSIPPEAYPTAPPPPVSHRLPSSVHDAQTIPPPGAHPAARTNAAKSLDALAQIDESWDEDEA